MTGRLANDKPEDTQECGSRCRAHVLGALSVAGFGTAGYCYRPLLVIRPVRRRCNRDGRASVFARNARLAARSDWLLKIDHLREIRVGKTYQPVVHGIVAGARLRQYYFRGLPQVADLDRSTRADDLRT